MVALNNPQRCQTVGSQNFLLNEHWTRCSTWLQNALDAAGNLATLDHVRSMVEENRAQFWPGRDCAVVTEVIDYPAKKGLNLWLAGGAMDELLTMQPAIRAYAKQQKCDIILIQGRPGWQKVFKKTPKWVCIVDEV
jgi:hypothetical protein